MAPYLGVRRRLRRVRLVETRGLRAWFRIGLSGSRPHLLLPRRLSTAATA